MSLGATVTGAGQSDIGRRLFRDPLELTIDACMEAITSAGLTRDDIDGLATYPGNMEFPPGFSGADLANLVNEAALLAARFDKAAVDRKDFGLGWNAVLEAGGLVVGDDVKITLSVQAIADKD